jgi:hypothetical protein
MAALTTLFLLGLAAAGGAAASKALTPKPPTQPNAPGPTDATKPQTSFVNTATPAPASAAASQSTAVSQASAAAARTAKRAAAASTLVGGGAPKSGNNFGGQAGPSSPATLIGG